LLGALPLDIRIREQADSGRPTVVADPDGEIARSTRRSRADDRGHAADVQRDLAQGQLDPLAVQAVLTEVILRRDGGPRTLFVRGMPVPRPWRAGAPTDRWAEAKARIAALRGTG
jgi:hypothetical protein